MKKSNFNVFCVICFLLSINILSFWVWWLKWVDNIIYGFCLGMLVKEYHDTKNKRRG